MSQATNVVIFSTKDKKNNKLHLFFNFFYKSNNQNYTTYANRISISLQPDSNEIKSIFDMINKNVVSYGNIEVSVVDGSSIKRILTSIPTNYKITTISKRRNIRGCFYFLYRLQDSHLKEFSEINNINVHMNLSVHYEGKERKKQTHYKVRAFLTEEDMLENQKPFDTIQKSVTYSKVDAQTVIYTQISDFLDSFDFKINNIYINTKYSENNSKNIMKKIINANKYDNVKSIGLIEKKIKRPLFDKSELLDIRDKVDNSLNHKIDSNKFHVIYSDGSCNESHFSAAFIIDSLNSQCSDSFVSEFKDGVQKNNSNYAELVALYCALNTVIQNKLFDKPLSFIFDSDFVALNLRWIKEKRYELISKQFKNSQLFRKIYKIIENYDINFVLTTIKSHSSNSHEMYKMNDKVDKMANNALKNFS